MSFTSALGTALSTLGRFMVLGIPTLPPPVPVPSPMLTSVVTTHGALLTNVSEPTALRSSVSVPSPMRSTVAQSVVLRTAV